MHRTGIPSGRRLRRPWPVALLLVASAIAACQVGPTATAPAQPTEIRIAVLPILDTLPLYVAEAEGYFADQEFALSFVTVASAAERDQLLQAGQVDGIITDLVALALYNRDASTRAEANVVAVRLAMVPTPDAAQFRVLASAASELATPADLANVPIGVSEGTIIEYVTDRVLEAEGLTRDEIVTMAVPGIPERMALLDAGDLRAATLPEPLASLAIQQGARVIVDDIAHPDVSASVYAFRRAFLAAHPDAVRRFLDAVDRASQAINADKGRWSDLLVERKLIPAPLEGRYPLPDYPGPAVPSMAQFEDVIAWLQTTQDLQTAPTYEAVITDAYLD